MARDLLVGVEENALVKINETLFYSKKAYALTFAFLAMSVSVLAQQIPNNAALKTTTVTCASNDDERRHCAAPTGAGVMMVSVSGSAACLLGKTWGYDDTGVWVLGGCSGEFLVAALATAPAPSTIDPEPPATPGRALQEPQTAPVATPAGTAGRETNTLGEPTIWGDWNPGRGFKVASTEAGELNLSGYMVGRYLNQLPADQTATDHLGRPLSVQARQDFQFHRVMLFSSGWFLDPKFKYFTFVWTVNDTTQMLLGGALTYDFNKHFNLGVGMNGMPGTRSLQGSHPYWSSYDRVMADEFFRPFFTQGVFGSGEMAPGLHYKWMVGNNLSLLGAKATQLDRDLNFSGSLTWMPTTNEFGPRGGFGDFEEHEHLATRFGGAYSDSRENRQSNRGEPNNNTTLRLADSLNVFDPDTFAPGVTVQEVTYQMAALDAGIKYRGFWLQAEGYYRLLDDFAADGPMPVRSVHDKGFYVQTSYMVVPRTVEIYGATSYIFSKQGHPKEFIVGGNWYPAKDRNYRLNVQLVNVDHSPVSSTFGFYTGRFTGQVVTVGVTVLY